VRIALVVPGGVSSVRAEGEIPALHALIERLATRHDVQVFSTDGHARLPYRFLGATVHHCGRSGSWFRTGRAIVAAHRAAPFDVVHAFWALPTGAIAAAAGRWIGRPVLVHVAGTELVYFPDIGVGGQRTWRGRRGVSFALRTASRVTGASSSVIQLLDARGIRGERVALGVDVTRWPALAPRRRTGSSARLVHVADLNPIKDQGTLLEAARLLAEGGLDFHLDIAGQDTLGGRIQDTARKLGLAGRVTFHGRVPHADLRALIAEGDLLLHSSRFEAGPLAVLEAAVVGVPTVGTAVGHIADWAPAAAVAVPVRDAVALAAEARRLLQDDDRRLSIAHEAQRRALACDADWTARTFEALYESVARR